MSMPAGLNDKSFELYTHNGHVYALHDGQRISYAEFPVALINLLDAIIESRPKAKAVLVALELNGHDARKQFIACNLSNFDNNPDVDVLVSKIVAEYVACDKRATCPYQGKLCQGIEAPNGNIGLAELRQMALIRKGLLDKEIAEALHISTETVKRTKKNISEKYGIERKAMIATIAEQLQIS